MPKHMVQNQSTNVAKPEIQSMANLNFMVVNFANMLSNCSLTNYCRTLKLMELNNSSSVTQWAQNTCYCAKQRSLS